MGKFSIITIQGEPATRICIGCEDIANAVAGSLQRKLSTRVTVKHNTTRPARDEAEVARAEDLIAQAQWS